MAAKAKSAHKWIFPSRFRAKAYSWKSSALAGKRIGEAVTEVSKVAKTGPHAAGEGVVLFLEKLVPAIESIDSSSGSLGNATNKAVLQLTQLFKSLPIGTPTRKGWLDRIWQAFEEDGYGYLDYIGVSVLSPPFPLTSPLARILGFTQGVPCPSSPKPKPAGF